MTTDGVNENTERPQVWGVRHLREILDVNLKSASPEVYLLHCVFDAGSAQCGSTIGQKFSEGVCEAPGKRHLLAQRVRNSRRCETAASKALCPPLLPAPHQSLSRSAFVSLKGCM